MDLDQKLDSATPTSITGKKRTYHEQYGMLSNCSSVADQHRWTVEEPSKSTVPENNMRPTRRVPEPKQVDC
jgi:hypothetical protein